MAKPTTTDSKRKPRTPKTLDGVTKVGWTPRQWCHASGLGTTKLYQLKNERKVDFIKIGRATIITTSPAEYYARLAAEQSGAAAGGAS